MDLLSNRAWDKTRPTRAQKGGARGFDSNGGSIAGAKKATHHVK
jgi:hypothetical protein